MDFRSNGSLEASLWMSRIDPERDSSAVSIETEVLQRAIAGDSAAFEQIVMRFERRVLTLAVRLLGNMSDAQDAAQEVFIRAYKYLHRFDARRPLEPWLVKMTINVCRTFGGKAQKRRHIFSNSAEPRSSFPSAAAPGDPHSELAAQQQKEIVHAALAELPEKERAAIVLRDLEGFSTSEVAQILGSSEATVRVQISTARVKIKKAIERLKGSRP
jgi:RNA polymerase sigma-70 factor, ECF subfamily